jgi:hypothetical protein
MRHGIVCDEQASERNFVARIGDKRLVRLYDYWRTKRAGRRCPARADIDPVEIPQLLPHLLLTELADGGTRFRWRLVGTEVERHFGAPMTGRYIDELLRGQYLEYLVGLYRTLVAGRTPVYSENSYTTRTGGWDAYSEVLRTARLMLPLAADGETVDMVLLGQVFFANSARADHTVFVTQDQFATDL